MKRKFAPSIAVLLVGCGSLGELKPPEGEKFPVKPAMAQVTPTAEDLLEPPAYAHPERVDESLKRSAPRKTDRFDLPPPDGGAAPSPDTTSPKSSETPAASDPK